MNDGFYILTNVTLKKISHNFKVCIKLGKEQMLLLEENSVKFYLINVQ